jgi:hypothetical protein
MLPSEMALLAHGWPRKVADNPQGAAAAAAAGGTVVSISSLGSQDEEGQIIEEQYYLPGEWLGSSYVARSSYLASCTAVDVPPCVVLGCMLWFSVGVCCC